MRMIVMMLVMFFSCSGCMRSITKIDMEKTLKRDIHQKIFDGMDEMFDGFSN